MNDSQNLDVTITGEGNSFEVEQSLTQSGFNPSVSTSCTQSVAQAFSGWFLFF